MRELKNFAFERGWLHTKLGFKKSKEQPVADEDDVDETTEFMDLVLGEYLGASDDDSSQNGEEPCQFEDDAVPSVMGGLGDYPGGAPSKDDSTGSASDGDSKEDAISISDSETDDDPQIVAMKAQTVPKTMVNKVPGLKKPEWVDTIVAEAMHVVPDSEKHKEAIRQAAAAKRIAAAKAAANKALKKARILDPEDEGTKAAPKAAPAESKDPTENETGKHKGRKRNADSLPADIEIEDGKVVRVSYKVERKNYKFYQINLVEGKKVKALTSCNLKKFGSDSNAKLAARCLQELAAKGATKELLEHMKKEYFRA